MKGLLPILKDESSNLPFSRIVACVRSEESKKKLEVLFSEYIDLLGVTCGDNVNAVRQSDVIVLGVDPADVEDVLTVDGMRDALRDKLLISVAAGWTKEKIESIIYGSATDVSNYESRAWVVRTLPNIACLVDQGLVVIPHEPSTPPLPQRHLDLTNTLFQCIGKTVEVRPRLMDAATAVGGSTPAFWAIICDAFIDASVAVGVPRAEATAMILQSMKGSAEMMQSGIHPGILRDQGTSAEGCTIGGIMVLEETGVRGHLGRALREAVTVARLMGTTTHVNDTRPTS